MFLKQSVTQYVAAVLSASIMNFKLVETQSKVPLRTRT